MKNKKTGKDRLKMYALGGIGDPEPKTYKTQAEIDKANATARRLAIKNRLVTGESTYAARKIGDPVVDFVNPDGSLYTGAAAPQGALTVPAGIGWKDIQSGQGLYWYNDPQTGDVVDLDPSFMRIPRIKREIDLAEGRTVAPITTETASNKFAGGGIADFAGLIPGIADSLIGLLENNPSAYSAEPLVNASTMRSMVSPYATGGVTGKPPIRMTSDYLNSIFIKDQNINKPQKFPVVQKKSDTTKSKDKKYASGGIHIKPENKGKFTASAKRAGMGVQQYAAKVLADPNASPLLRRRANFARNAASWKHAMGGTSGDIIEVEGDEVLETPSGTITQVQGPSHENGGVDVAVPDGTRIYSDRLKIGNKTMQQRKLARERAVSRLQKLVDKNPTDKILKSSLERTIATTQIEDSQDMEIQEVADDIYNYGTFAMGGRKGKMYAFGGETDPYISYLQNLYGMNTTATPPFLPGGREPLGIDLPSANIPNLGATGPTISDEIATAAGNRGGGQIPGDAGTTVPAASVNRAGRLSLGDYIGLAGNAFNAIAPLVNTEANAAASKPNVNRFLGFGNDALEDNSQAQNIASGLRTSALTDISTAAQGARNRNRNSASSISTLRALDAVTDIGTQRATVSANDAFANQMIGLMGQRSELENIQDRMEMTGEATRDMEDKADIDNYYSNKAQNLVNLGTNVQGIGRALNTAKSNRVDARLLGQLSQYGLEIDDDGNLISIR